jgi:2-polyprenyl-3-methyl-5-hydroxy-6-metoxy-1,4-benzoquinol methylase
MKKTDILNKIWKFRELCLSHVYSEPDTSIHTMVMDHMIPKFIEEVNLNTSSKILDVGCGHGYGMQKFAELGFKNISGITLSKVDADGARERGFKVNEEDMSFQSAKDKTYDVLFARHSLEHSPYPLLTLLEFNRILKKGGIAYIEMPSPGCTRDLESYDNHYSIMGTRQWNALMIRAGFTVVNIGNLKFDINNKETEEDLGKEIYEWYIISKN